MQISVELIHINRLAMQHGGELVAQAGAYPVNGLPGYFLKPVAMTFLVVFMVLRLGICYESLAQVLNDHACVDHFAHIFSKCFVLNAGYLQQSAWLFNEYPWERLGTALDILRARIRQKPN